jgi:predicted fused transcriptional regulator/phosphomethylpyrimidine kinase
MWKDMYDKEQEKIIENNGYKTSRVNRNKKQSKKREKGIKKRQMLLDGA